MLKALIIDDEEKSREALFELISQYCPELEVIGKALSVDDAHAQISRNMPDVVFLDIEMPHKNGFQLLENYPDPDFEIIFTTAYNQYAIRAIKYSALDYLLKPIDIEELKETVSRLIQKKSEHRSQQLPVKTLINNLKTGPNPGKLLIPSQDGFLITDIEAVISFTSNGNYCIVNILKEEPVFVSKTLKYFEEILPPEQFIRIHNSTIINIHHIKKYIKDDGGFVVMKDDSKYEISRRKKNEFLERIFKL